MEKRRKEATSMRLSPQAKQLLEQLSEHLGVPKTNVMEQAIRLLARREKVTAPRKDGHRQE